MEYVYPERDDQEYLELLPFYAIPDGAHNSTHDSSLVKSFVIQCQAKSMGTDGSA